MTTFSAVAVALKTDVYNALSAESKKLLNDNFETRESHEDGLLFHGENLKWGTTINTPISEFYNELKAQDSDSGFRVVEACYDYPDHTAGDIGDWTDNPWGIHKNVPVFVSFDSVGEPLGASFASGTV